MRSAVAALSAVAEGCRLVMSIARNISERNVGKSSKRKVGRCRGFIDIVPVVGSMVIFCIPVSAEDIMMPLVEPGAAM